MTTIPTGISWGFDCLGDNVQRLIDAGAKPAAIWPYISGSDGIEWTEAQIDHWKATALIYRVNQGYHQGPGDALKGDEFDVENGAWSIAQMVEIVRARRAVSWSTRVYGAWATYGTLKQELAQAGVGGSVWWRIADWNLDEHLADLELHADVYAGQWASPSSNPATLVPGTRLTLAEAGADLSVVLRENTGWVG